MAATADVPPCAAMPSREGAAPRDRPLRPVGKVRRGSPRHVVVACARQARLQLRYLRTRVQGACWASSARGEAGARPGGLVRTPAAGEASVLCHQGPCAAGWGWGGGNTKRRACVFTLWIISRARGVGSVARQSHPRRPWHTGRRAGDRLCMSDGVCRDHPGPRGRSLAHLGARRRSDRRSAAQWGLQGLWDRARAAWPQLGRQGRR
jgi:hypothetical protein